MRSFLKILTLVLVSASMASAADFAVKYIQTKTAPLDTPIFVNGNVYSMHDENIFVIDSRTNALSTVIPIRENIRVGGKAYETSVVGQYIYVFGLSISVIDSNTNKVIKTIPISSNYAYGPPDYVSYQPSKIVQGHYLYVFRLKDEHSFVVHKIDTNIHEIIETIALTNEHETFNHPDLIVPTSKDGHFAIPHKHGGKLTLVDLNTRQISKTFLTKFESVVSKDNLIYMVNQQGDVSVIDSNNNDEITATIGLNNKTGYYQKGVNMVVISDHVYVLEHLSNDPQRNIGWQFNSDYDCCIVSVIDITSAKIVKSFDLKTYKTNFIAIRDKLYLDSPAEIVVIDTRSVEVIKRIQKSRDVHGWLGAAGEHISMTDTHSLSIINTNTDQIAATFFRDARPVCPLVNGRFMYAPEVRSMAIYDLADFLGYEHANKARL